MIEWLLLLPVLFPLIGAVLFTLITRAVPRARGWLAAAVLVLELAAILVNIAPFNHRLVLSEWQLTSFALVLEMDGIGILLLLTILVILAALWLVAPPRTLLDPWTAGIWSCAALLITAGNLVTIYIAWVLLDLAIYGWRLRYDVERETALRSLATGQAAGLILFAGASFGNPGLGLVTLAFWARLALYPFHWILPLRGIDSRDLNTARGIPLLAASSLWIRFRPPEGLPRELFLILAVFGLVCSVIWTWNEEQPPRVVVMGAWHAVVLIPLAALFGGDAALAFALWLTLAVACSLALFEIGLRWRAENRNRWARIAWFAGLITLAGLPLTPAFVGRLGMYVALLESGQWIVGGAAGIATLLVLTPLWNIGVTLTSPEPRDPTRIEYAGLALMFAAFLALALAPMLIAHALGPAVGNSAEATLRRVIWTGDAIGVSIGVLTLLLSAILSFALHRVASEFRPKPRGWLARFARLTDLEWLVHGVCVVGYEMGVIARNISTIGEENPTIWILLAALWIAIFVLIPR